MKDSKLSTTTEEKDLGVLIALRHLQYEDRLKKIGIYSLAAYFKLK